MVVKDTNEFWGDIIGKFIKDEVTQQVFTDITLVCEDGERIKAHKVILCMYSKLLRDALEEEEDVDLIIVPHLSFNNIKMMLEFLYSGRMTLTLENMLDVGIVADVLGCKNMWKKLLDSNEEKDLNNCRSVFSNPSVILENENIKEETEENICVPIDIVSEFDALQENKTSVKDNAEKDSGVESDTIHENDVCLDAGVENACDTNDADSGNNLSAENVVNDKAFTLLCNIENFLQTKIEEAPQTQLKLGKTNRNEHFCNKCSFSTKYFDNLLRHQLTMHEGVSYQCNHCDFVSRHKVNVQVHNLVKHEGVKYPCLQCSNIYTAKSSLKAHEEAVHQGNTYNCKHCDFTAASNSYLKRHVQKEHEGLVFPCNHCKYVAKDKSNLRQHNMSKHESNVFNCRQCEYKSTTVRNVNNHTKIVHEGKRYDCDQCDYKAKNSGHLKLHHRVKHEGVKHQCEHCTYQTGFKGDLKRHILTKHEMKN